MWGRGGDAPGGCWRPCAAAARARRPLSRKRAIPNLRCDGGSAVSAPRAICERTSRRRERQSPMSEVSPKNIHTCAPIPPSLFEGCKKSDGGVFFKFLACPPRTWGGCAAREGGGWRGGSARAARRVAHLGGSARAARRGWGGGRHLSRRAGHCAPSSRGQRHGGVWRGAVARW